jgi:hypothetical protein
VTYKRRIDNRDGYAKYAAIQNIDAVLAMAKRDQTAAAEEVRWLLHLRRERAEQLEAGTWPPSTDEGIHQ